MRRTKIVATLGPATDKLEVLDSLLTAVVDDGRIVLKVEGITPHRVECKVLMGGPLSNNKGLNREGGGLSARALTPKDEKDIHHAIEYGADYVAVSFPRNGDDIKEARRWIEKADGKAGVIAKIERAEA